VCECREMSTNGHLQLLLCQLNSQCVDTTTKIPVSVFKFHFSWNSYLGTLSAVTPETASLGSLSFVQLIGTAYFKLNVASFFHPTLQPHFNSLSEPNLTSKQHHLRWLDEVCSTCWVCAGSPADEMPSNDALMLHWRRSLGDAHVASVLAEPSGTATNYTLWVGNGWGHS